MLELLGKKLGLGLLAFFWLLALPGCGYTLQGAHSTELERFGIHRIYVEPLTNNTYKSGVENIVYNALVKGLSTYRGIQIVSNKEDADAFVKGSVDMATFAGSFVPSAQELGPKSSGGASLGSQFKDFTVATEYAGTLTCSFALVRLKREKPESLPEPVVLWSTSIRRDKPFPANNQLGPLGTTSALINDSEFDRTLNDMAQDMMGQVRESLLARF